jgi:YegS/Rv2252/BmrU family lipid kinase
MKAIVITNPGAGAKPDEQQELRRALEAAGIEADIRIVEGEDLTRAARDAVSDGCEVVIAAGGDGTISAVAAALVDGDVPLGVLPTGTLNHFAKDLKIPNDLAEAARIIAARKITRADVAEVNEKFFLNNSSIGIYPHIVKHRDRQRERLGRGKWVAMVVAAMSVFRRHPLVNVRLEADGQPRRLVTPFVFVGNNVYDISLNNLGGRSRIDEGVLSIYLTRRSTRFALLVLAFRAVLGTLEQSKDFESSTARELWIETSKKTLRVAADGEVLQLVPPLHYRIRPRALPVITP